MMRRKQLMFYQTMQDMVLLLNDLKKHNFHPISIQFEKLLHERSGTAHVTKCTASKVTKQNQKQLLKTIEEIFGVEHIKPEFVVDTSLISGYKATCRDKVYNASMLGQLKTVHQSLIYQ